MAAHTRGCASCRVYARDLHSLHRSLRVRSAAPVPDLTRSIMATAGARLPAAPRRTTVPVLRPTWPRVALIAVALGQLALALPELVVHTHAGHSAHMTRELGAFGVALAIGMLVVAWQPQRASGLLPMTFALTTAVTVTALADVVLGHSGPSGQATHFLELVGLVLLWYLARSTGPSRATRRSARDRSPAAV